MAIVEKLPESSHLGSKDCKLYVDEEDIHRRLHDPTENLRARWQKNNLQLFSERALLIDTSFPVIVDTRYVGGRVIGMGVIYRSPPNLFYRKYSIPHLYANSFDVPPKDRILSSSDKKRLEKTRVTGDNCQLCLSRRTDVLEKTNLIRAVLTTFPCAAKMVCSQSPFNDLNLNRPRTRSLISQSMRRPIGFPMPITPA